MSEILDLPQIDPDLIERPAAVPARIETQALTLKQTVIASFATIRIHCTALAAKYRGVAYDLATPKGLKDAKAARLELREEGRYAVQRLQDRLKAEANDLKRVVDDEAAQAVAVLKPVEDKLDADIKAREKEVAEAKAAAERKEAERVAGHQAAIAKIRAYLTHAQQPGMTSARISAGMDLLRDWAIGPEFEEFAVPAANAQCETLEAMRVLRDEVLAREQAAQRAAEEAARIEAQRLENERIAAEQRAQAEALAAQQRALAEQAAALAAKEAAIRRADEERMAAMPYITKAAEAADAPAAPVATAAATEGKADNPEPGKLEAAPITPNTQESGSCPADAPACASSGADTAQAPLCGDEGPARADQSVPVSAPESLADRVLRLGNQMSYFEAAEGNAYYQERDARERCRADFNVAAREAIASGVKVNLRGCLVPADVIAALKPTEENTTSGAAPQHASDHPMPEADAAPGGTDEGADFGAIEAELNDGPAYEVDHDPAEMERISGVRVILAGPEEDSGPAVPAGPPTLKLGTISERLGFMLTEGFLETLGFPPAARERAARLYHESDWHAICDELVAHVLRCKSGEGA